MRINRNTAFVAKYAPKSLSEIVFADVAVEKEIERYISGGDLRPLILYGPNGTGKSTIANYLPYAIEPNVHPFDIYKFDPATVPKESVLRDNVNDFIIHTSINGTEVKFIILEEFDLFKEPLVACIKSVIDASYDFVLTIVTTNNINKLDRGHRSRAICLRIEQAPLERWMPRITTILAAEEVRVPPEHVLEQMLKGSKGDNRHFLDDLQRYVEMAKEVQQQCT